MPTWPKIPQGPDKAITAQKGPTGAYTPMVGHFVSAAKAGAFLAERDVAGSLAGYISGNHLPAGRGVDSSRNTGTTPATDPVAPNGEFVIDTTDVTFPGYGLPFAFTRHYRSAVMYSTPLGYGWNHEFARRIVPLRTTPLGFTPTQCVSSRREVAYIDGRMNRIRFALQSTSADGLVDSYLPTAGDDLRLAFDRKTNRWQLTGEGDAISTFDGFYGTLSAVADYAGHTLNVEWDHTTYPEWQDMGGVVASVTDTTGRVIHFNYVPALDGTKVVGHVLKCLSGALDCTSSAPLVRFDSKTLFAAPSDLALAEHNSTFEANLVGATRADGTAVSYAYDETTYSGYHSHPPHEAHPSSTDADPFCHKLCDASDATCSTVDACQRAIDEMRAYMCGAIHMGKTPFWIEKDSVGHVARVTGPHADYPNPGSACYEFCLAQNYPGGAASVYLQSQTNCIYAAEQPSSTMAGQPYDACAVTFKPDCDRQLDVLQANVGTCRTSCLSSCKASLANVKPHFDDGLGAAHRLVRVTDGEGRIVVDNQYANDSSRFDYGRIVKHAQGAALPGTSATTMTFTYTDYESPNGGGLPALCGNADPPLEAHDVDVFDTHGVQHSRKYDRRWRLLYDYTFGTQSSAAYVYAGDHLRGFSTTTGGVTCIDVDALGKPTRIERTPWAGHRGSQKLIVTKLSYDAAEQLVEAVQDAEGDMPRGVHYIRDAAERIIATGVQVSAQNAEWTCHTFTDTPLSGGGSRAKPVAGDTPPIYVPPGGTLSLARASSGDASSLPRAQSFIGAIVGSRVGALAKGGGGGGGGGGCPSWGCGPPPMFSRSGCALGLVPSPHDADASYFRAAVPSVITRPDESLVVLSGIGVGGARDLAVTDSDGVTPLVETYVDYDSYGYPAVSGRVVAGKRVPGSGTATTYDPISGRLLKVIRESTNGGSATTTTYEYDKSGQMRKMVAPTLTRTVDVDALGHVVAISEAPASGYHADPRRSCFNVDVEGRINDIIHAEGDAIHFDYNNDGHVVAESRGALGTYGPWAAGCVQITPRAMETFATYQYEWFGGAPKSRVVNQREIDYALDGFGRIVDEVEFGHSEKIIVPNGPTGIGTAYIPVNLHHWREYDAFDEVILDASYDVVVDPKNAPPDFVRPSAPTPGLHSLSEYSYDHLGRSIAMTKWRFTEQGGGLSPPIPLPDPLGDAITRIQYDDLGRTVTTTNPDGHVSIEAFDPLGRPVRRLRGAGETSAVDESYQWSTSADPAALDVLSTTRSPAPTSSGKLVGVTAFDAHGLVRSVAEADRKVASIDYDDFDRALHRTTPQLGRETFEVDAYGRLTTTHRPFTGGDASTTTHWDRDDRVVAVIDGAQHTTTYSYDPQGRPATETTALGTTARTYVPGRAALATVTAPGGQTVTYRYSPPASPTSIGDGRLQSRHASSGNNLDRDQVFYYTNAGLLAGIGGASLTYDSLGRVVTDDPAVGIKLSYAYSPDQQQLVVAQGPSAATLARGFDAVGRVTKVSLNGAAVATLDYSTGALSSIAFANGVTQSWAYDDRARGVGTTVNRGAAVASNVITYGADDVPRARTRSVGAFVATDLYTADAIGRVMAENLGIPGLPSLGGTVSGNIRDLSNEDVQSVWSSAAPNSTYTLDGASNWTSRQGTNAFTPTIDDLNRYTAIDKSIVGYDGQGRVSGYGDESYTFDGDGQMLSGTKAGITTAYHYDGFGRRVSERRDGHYVSYIWDGDRIVATMPDGDLSLGQLRLGAGSDDTLALADGLGNGAVRYVHPGVDASTIAATDVNGLVVESYAYSAYGDTTFLDATGRAIGASRFGNRFLFQGQLYDPALASYSMRAREYKPAWGRFLSPDPAGLAFGDNRFAFVDSRPLTMSDPSGLDAQLAGLYQQAWATDFSYGATGALDNYYRRKYGLTANYARSMAGVRSTAMSVNYHGGNFGLAAMNSSLGMVDVVGSTILGDSTRDTVRNVAGGIVVGGVIGTFFKWALGTGPVWNGIGGVAGADVTGATLNAGAGSGSGAAAADVAQTMRPRPATAATLETSNGAFTGVSGSATPLHPLVEDALQSIPANDRSQFHGRCAEPQAISRAFEAGIDPAGGTMSAVRVRAAGNPNHGTPIPPCATCAVLQDIFGIKTTE